MTIWIVIAGPKGERKVAEGAPFQLEKGEAVIGSSTEGNGVGLGDVIAKVTTFFGAKPCAPCNRRRRRLNEIRLPKIF